MIIKQKKYGKLEIDNTEKDIVQILMHEKISQDYQIVMIERANVNELINQLNKCNTQ